jgi:hypothetical protein
VRRIALGAFYSLTVCAAPFVSAVVWIALEDGKSIAGW